MSASDEEQPSKGFKVQDRRRFSAEGELKPEFSSAEEPSSAPSQDASASAETGAARGTAQPPGGAGESARQAAAQAPHAAEAHPAQERAALGAQEEPAAEINFAAFLMSLSTEALVHLGEMPDPASGAQRRDLAMAQQLIDILGMLRDKTRGNLDRDEQALLDAILFDLRMKYVEIARRVG